MPITLDGTNGITTPEIISTAGPVVINASAPDNSLVVAANGNVGIGSSSPSSKLEVNTGSLTAYFTRTAGDTGVLDPAFGIGTASATTRLGSSGDLQFMVGAVGTAAISQNERMRITSAGTVFFCGSTTSGVFNGNGVDITATGEVSINTLTGAPLDINQSTADTVSRSMIRFFRNETQTGSITANSTATAYVTASDYRLKENVQPMTGALGLVTQLNPVTYTWKSDGSDGQGFIAHELQAVIPDCVVGEKDAVDADGKPQYQGVDTSFLVATLVKAVQELTARIEALETTQ